MRDLVLRAPRRGAGIAAATTLLVVGLVLVGSLALPEKSAADENWATQRARELVVQGDGHREQGHVDLAIERYRQAIEIDPTFGQAYLALGRLRESTGDLLEAERTYAAGIEHINGFAEGLLARGELRAHTAKPDAALSDMMAALALHDDDMAALRRVRETSIALGRLPVALAVDRRLGAVAHDKGDAAAEHEAAVTASALEMLVGFVDPVAAGTDRGAVRIALAKLVTPAPRASKPAPPPKKR